MHIKIKLFQVFSTIFLDIIISQSTLIRKKEENQL